MPLKPVDKKKNPGLAKLPTGVRNKMGYMKDGGSVKKKATKEEVKKYRRGGKFEEMRSKKLQEFSPKELKQMFGYKEGGAIKREKKKEDKPQGMDPLGLMKPKGPKKVKETKPKKGVPLPMTPELIKKAKEGKYENPRAPKRDRDEIRKAKPLKEGGMVLEIGLRPATKSEMKMAKEMKPMKKAGGGMVSRGSGAAIRGNKFKGVF